ncbi:MAG: hypothetical protein H0Z33_16695 [Bacillaceae bacterium]|nr:hypothetical protein [Bacillaceae bacterium]
MVDETTTITETITLTEAPGGDYTTSLVSPLPLVEELSRLPSSPSKTYSPPTFHFYVGGVEKGLKSFTINLDASGRVTINAVTYDTTITEDDVLNEIELTITDPTQSETRTLVKGVLINVETSESTSELHLTGRGLEYHLEHDVFTLTDEGGTHGIFEYDQERADVVASAILADTPFTLVECPTTQISVRLDYEKRLYALQLIADILSKGVWVDTGYGVHIGEKSNAWALNEVKQLKLTQTGADTYNRVIVIGGNNGEGKVPVGIAEDGSLIATNGVKTKKLSLPEIQDKETALLLAKAYLNAYKTVNYVLDATLPPKFTNYLIEPGHEVTVNETTYTVTTVRLTPQSIQLTASPVKHLITLQSFLERQLRRLDTTSTTNTFYNESPYTLTAYEHIELTTDYYGGSTPKTITANDTNTYTILNVMHFYAPANFTAEEATIKGRWYSDETPSAFKVIVNGEVLTPSDDGSTDDGDTLYTITIPPTLITPGWNNVYFVE